MDSAIMFQVSQMDTQIHNMRKMIEDERRKSERDSRKQRKDKGREEKELEEKDNQIATLRKEILEMQTQALIEAAVEAFDQAMKREMTKCAHLLRKSTQELEREYTRKKTARTKFLLDEQRIVKALEEVEEEIKSNVELFEQMDLRFASRLKLTRRETVNPRAGEQRDQIVKALESEEAAIADKLRDLTLMNVPSNLKDFAAPIIQSLKERCKKIRADSRKHRVDISGVKTIPAVECSSCMEGFANDDIFEFRCNHSKYCMTCMVGWLKSCLESKEENFPPVCETCREEKARDLFVIDPEIALMFLEGEDLTKFEKFFIEAKETFIYCPRCKEPIVNDANVSQSVCPSCTFCFCKDCQVVWHAQFTCEEYQALPEEEKKEEDRLALTFMRQQYKQCSRCGGWKDKIAGCNHITCTCGNHFCWTCGFSANSGGEVYTHMNQVGHNG